MLTDAKILIAADSPTQAAEIAARWMGLGEPIVYATNAAYRYAPLPDQHVSRRGGASVMR